eukprot:gene5066-1434_t
MKPINVPAGDVPKPCPQVNMMDVPAVIPKLSGLLVGWAAPALAVRYPDLLPDTALLRVHDCFFSRFVRTEANEQISGLDRHRDPGEMTAVVHLSDPATEFDGGGTAYEVLDN